MARNFPDWLTAFCDYAQFGEAPRRMYFWVGVSALAGALKRKVWIDQAYFKWYANFYIVLVAPPGIVSKSTTAGISMNLLRDVVGAKFGPEVVTWQALVSAFADSAETFEYQGAHHTMSALTIESSEFGNLLNPADKEMVDMLVNLWDGKSVRKITKGSGSDSVVNPWINLVACTTPAWIAGNFPEYMVGGGFTSRCLFVYAQEKDKYVAYPGLEVPKNLDKFEEALIADLQHISEKLVGEYVLSKEAVDWGKEWYEHHYKNRPPALDDDRFGGYIARKQTHIHKLSMILAASRHDDMVIEKVDLETANDMVSNLEADMPMVFSRIGKSEESAHVDRFVNFIRKRGKVEYTEAYRFIHSAFPGFKDFENMVSGAMRAGLIKVSQVGNSMYLTAGDV